MLFSLKIIRTDEPIEISKDMYYILQIKLYVHTTVYVHSIKLVVLHWGHVAT